MVDISAGDAFPTDGIVTATYIDSVNATGFGQLDIVGNASAPNALMAYAAGYAEAVLTANASGHNLIYDYVQASVPQISTNVRAWLVANQQYSRQQILAHPTDSFWVHVNLVNEQMTGLCDGYTATAPAAQAVRCDTIMTASLLGDLFDLNALNSMGSQAEFEAFLQQRRTPGRRAQPGSGTPIPSHCSSLTRFLPDGSDVFSAHTTWSGVETMLRIWKRYQLPFTVDGTPGAATVPGVSVAFTSYPATLSSVDDFYTVQPSGLVVIETTIGNNNMSLYQDYMVPQTVVEFMRNIVANRLAVNGSNWPTVFSQQNSGTYNNEWMITDTKLFASRAKPSDPLPAWTLTVADQMPGFVSVDDRTSWLNTVGYWPSFNVPSNDFIFNISNQWALVEQYGGLSGAGAFYAFNTTCRRQIFDRDAPKVTDLASMQAIQRYNDYQNDPLSGQGMAPGYKTPFCAISSRGDLGDTDPSHAVIPGLGHGDNAGIDSKIASAKSVAAGSNNFWAQSGPTHDQQKVFTWATEPFDVLHGSQPAAFNFGWEEVTWA